MLRSYWTHTRALTSLSLALWGSRSALSILYSFVLSLFLFLPLSVCFYLSLSFSVSPFLSNFHFLLPFSLFLSLTLSLSLSLSLSPSLPPSLPLCVSISLLRCCGSAVLEQMRKNNELFCRSEKQALSSLNGQAPRHEWYRGPRDSFICPKPKTNDIICFLCPSFSLCLSLYCISLSTVSAYEAYCTV